MSKSEELKLVIKGNPITKKNSQRIVWGNGRYFICPSHAYKRYEAEAVELLPDIETIDRPINVETVYYMKTRRKVDLVNLQEATLDILSEAKIIADDNCRIVVSMDGSHVRYDKEDPRVEITITDAKESKVEDWSVKK